MIDSLLTALQSNPTVQGSIALGLTVGLSYLGRAIPATVGRFIRTQLTCEVELDNSGQYWTEGSDFNKLRQWAGGRTIKRLSRAYRFEPEYKDNPDTGFVCGTGNHFFFHNRRLFWISIHNLESSGVSFNKQLMRIVGLTRQRQRLQDIVAEATKVESTPHTQITVYGVVSTSEGVQWRPYSKVPFRVDPPLINAEAYTELTAFFDRYTEGKDWMRDQGISPKRTALLYGPPGTGKSTLAVQLASLYMRDLYVLNVTAIDCAQLPRIIGAIPASSMILMEDIHSCYALLNAETRLLRDNPNPATYHAPPEGIEFTSADLGQVLNFLSGVVPLDDHITIMTTNYLEYLEPALYRPGRVDLCLEVGYLDWPALHQWLTRTYGEAYTNTNDPAITDAGVQLLSTACNPNRLTTGDVYLQYERHREDLLGLLNDLITIAYNKSRGHK